MRLLVVTLIYAIFSQSEGKSVKQLNDDKKPVAFDEVIGRNIFGAGGFGGTWISEKEFTYTTGGNLTIFDMATNSSRILLDNAFSVSKVFTLIV